LSQYEISLPAVKDMVGFGGSVLVDACSLDLVRLEIQVREIPKDLRMTAGRTVIDYGHGIAPRFPTATSTAPNPRFRSVAPPRRQRPRLPPHRRSKSRPGSRLTRS